MYMVVTSPYFLSGYLSLVPVHSPVGWEPLGLAMSYKKGMNL